MVVSEKCPGEDNKLSGSDCSDDLKKIKVCQSVPIIFGKLRTLTIFCVNLAEMRSRIITVRLTTSTFTVQFELLI